MNLNKLLYIALRLLLFPVRFLPFKTVHCLGKILGYFAFHLHTKFRKRTLSNLSLAKTLNLPPEKVRQIAIESFQNLAITTLEYEKFNALQETSAIECLNPEQALSIIEKGQGIVFFCGHQANWEVLFLDGTQKMPGVAIGRPIKNPYLYQWIVKIREKFGGKIITPKQALKGGLKALKEGKFLGIVGDQGMPESGFEHEFLGQTCFSSPAPALLAYKAKCPMIVATTVRKNGKYFITYSDPMWPDTNQPISSEVPKMMNSAFKLFEKSIIDHPGQWLWQHNRFKKETRKTLYLRYRHDTVLVLYPEEEEKFDLLFPIIKLFEVMYPKASVTHAVQEKHLAKIKTGQTVLPYSKLDDLFFEDFQYKFVYNFTGDKRFKSHFLKQAALEVVDFQDIKKDAQKHMLKDTHYTLIETMLRATCRPGTTWEEDASKPLLH